MSKEANFYSGVHLGNGNGKYAFESSRKESEVEVFLKKAKVERPVKRIIFSSNGHNASATWIGNRNDAFNLDKNSIVEAKGTGCLEIVEDSKRTLLFFEAGKVIEEQYKNMNETIETDPRQLRMNI